MSYYAVFLPMKNLDKSEKFRLDHLNFLNRMRKEKKILINGKFTDNSGGLVIYKAKDMQEVKSFVNQDPYIVEGARDYVINEWEMVTDLNV